MAYDLATGQVPYESKNTIKGITKEFRTNNHAATFPVDVEAICDKINVDISPIEGLNKLLSVDAFITSDFKKIYVDDSGYKKESARYRFSVAHELGHLVLHKKYYPDDIINFETYLKLSPKIQDKRVEFQANYFAANLLAPDEKLSEILCKRLDEDPEENFWKVGQEKQAQIISELCKVFGISEQTAVFRMEDVYPKIFDGF